MTWGRKAIPYNPSIRHDRLFYVITRPAARGRGSARRPGRRSVPGAIPGRRCHSSLPLAAIDGHCLGIYTVILLPLLSLSAEMMAPPRLAGTSFTKMQQWMASSNPDWPEEGRQGQLANFEVLGDGTVTPWLTFERHLQVLRGLWEHRPFPSNPAI